MSYGKIQWVKHEAGAWLPRDANEFHNCPLYVACHGGISVSVHKTADGRGWIATSNEEHYRNAKVFRSRIKAFWGAVDRARRGRR